MNWLQKLSTSKVADNFFQLVIAPTHGCHFVSVRFDATTSVAIIEFTKALPFLPNLRTINLTRELLDGIRRLDAPVRQAVEERLDLVIETGIRDLTLHRLPLNATVRFTARAPNVTSLTLFISDPSVIDELWSIILPMRHLANLSLTCVATAPAEPFQTATLLSAQPRTKPALSSLVLYGHLSTDGLADFIAVFASNLRHLTVGIVESASQTGTPQPVLPACSFPRLRSLALKLPEALQQTTLDATPGPPQLPNWRTLTTSRQQPPLSASSIASFARLFARHTGVKHVLSDSLCIRVSHLDSFNSVADSPSRLVGGNTSDKYPIVAMTDSDTIAERLQRDTAWEQRRNTLDAIDDVLAYAIERRKRIAATEDWADAARFVKNLGHLDLERMIHRL